MVLWRHSILFHLKTAILDFFLQIQPLQCNLWIHGLFKMLSCQWKLNDDLFSPYPPSLPPIPSPNTQTLDWKWHCSSQAGRHHRQGDAAGGWEALQPKPHMGLGGVQLLDLVSSSSGTSHWPPCLTLNPAWGPGTWCLWAGPVHEAKHVSAGLAHGCHLGQDWEVVNHKGHLIPLLLGQVLRVAQDPEARDVSGRVGVERVHESRRCQRTEEPLSSGVMNGDPEKTPFLNSRSYLCFDLKTPTNWSEIAYDESEINTTWGAILKVGFLVQFEPLRTAASTNSKFPVN